MTRGLSLTTGVIWISLVATSAVAQDLDPRAYARVPVGFTVAIAGVSFSSGGVLTDPTLVVGNVHADVLTPSLGVAQSFSLFGRTAQGLAALPYSWAHATGDVGERTQRIDRSGLSDMRLRLSVLLAGAPAMTPQQLAKSPRRPIVGASLTVGAPSGQYSSQRLVNLGTNRWSFKPEVALSYPLAERWLVDVYAGLWLFGTNGSYSPAWRFASRLRLARCRRTSAIPFPLKRGRPSMRRGMAAGKCRWTTSPLGGASRTRASARLWFFPSAAGTRSKSAGAQVRSSDRGLTSPHSRWAGKRVGSIGGLLKSGRTSLGLAIKENLRQRSTRRFHDPK